MATEDSQWFDDYVEESEDFQVEEYDITASPNDFNVLTIFSFLESGAVKIPGFQRNYVWDLGRASKLIESLILGLPVPQVFLYETDRNKFLVIDGQQRLMSIYYFLKQRFPRREKRTELRAIFDDKGIIPEEVIHDDVFFENFRLKLPEVLPNRPNKFKNLAYATLGAYKTPFELRTIRNVIIKQNSPSEDDSSMYEVFNRLNTGGVNLRPQEIRMSMYHSPFYDKLYKANANPKWRRLTGSDEPDLHMKDVEVLLRSFALLVDIHNYAPSMVKFLNQFSKKCKRMSDDENAYLASLLSQFVESCSDLPPDAFVNKANRRFDVALFESVFAGTCAAAFHNRRALNGKIDLQKLQELSTDVEFRGALIRSTTDAKNVRKRVERATAVVGTL
jgi:hypothetical protein